MYDLVLRDIETVFSSENWTSNKIPTYPSNYQGSKSQATEYTLLSVMPSGSNDYAYDAKKELSGLVAVKIFVKAGEGQGRTMAIADLLDLVLQHKQLPNGTILKSSHISMGGLDLINKSLYSATYLIPFTKFGE